MRNTDRTTMPSPELVVGHVELGLVTIGLDGEVVMLDMLAVVDFERAGSTADCCVERWNTIGLSYRNRLMVVDQVEIVVVVVEVKTAVAAVEGSTAGCCCSEVYVCRMVTPGMGLYSRMRLGNADEDWDSDLGSVEATVVD